MRNCLVALADDIVVAAAAHDVDPVVHLRQHGGKDRLVARRLIRHEHPPDAVLAVPEVPVGIPAESLPAGLAVADVDEVLVGIAPEIAIRILKLHETMALFANKGKELPVLEIVGDARGGQHLLAPEFAAPESANLRLVVVTELERLPRLVEHLIAHDRIETVEGFVKEDIIRVARQREDRRRLPPHAL